MVLNLRCEDAASYQRPPSSQGIDLETRLNPQPLIRGVVSHRCRKISKQSGKQRTCNVPAEGCFPSCGWRQPSAEPVAVQSVVFFRIYLCRTRPVRLWRGERAREHPQQAWRWCDRFWSRPRGWWGCGSQPVCGSGMRCSTVCNANRGCGRLFRSDLRTNPDPLELKMQAPDEPPIWIALRNG